MAEKITVEFDEQGNPSIHVQGVKGRSCKDLTKEIEKDLGVVIADTTTAEFAQAPKQGVQVRQ